MYFQIQRERFPLIGLEEYSEILELLRNPVPPRRRTEHQQKLMKTIWKYKLFYSNIHDPWVGYSLPRLTISARIVLPKEDIAPCVSKFYHENPDEGSRELTKRLRKHYFGIGEKAVQSVIASFNVKTETE